MKLFRNVRQGFVEQGNVKKYIPYAIGEILLVMIGILLAFQVSTWNDNRIKKNNEKIYYQNIKDQIKSTNICIEIIFRSVIIASFLLCIQVNTKFASRATPK